MGSWWKVTGTPGYPSLCTVKTLSWFNKERNLLCGPQGVCGVVDKITILSCVSHNVEWCGDFFFTRGQNVRLLLSVLCFFFCASRELYLLTCSSCQYERLFTDTRNTLKPQTSLTGRGSLNTLVHPVPPVYRPLSVGGNQDLIQRPYQIISFTSSMCLLERG